MELVADCSSSAMNIIHDVMFSSNEHRLAQTLLTQIQLQEAAFLQPTHNTLTHELGTVREIVSRLLRQSRRDGLLQ